MLDHNFPMNMAKRMALPRSDMELSFLKWECHKSSKWLDHVSIETTMVTTDVTTGYPSR